MLKCGHDERKFHQSPGGSRRFPAGKVFQDVLTGQRLAAFAPTAVVLHPGPIIRGLELTAEVADGPQSAILEQVRNGVAIRMAVVERALQAASLKGGRA